MNNEIPNYKEIILRAYSEGATDQIIMNRIKRWIIYIQTTPEERALAKEMSKKRIINIIDEEIKKL